MARSRTVAARDWDKGKQGQLNHFMEGGGGQDLEMENANGQPQTANEPVNSTNGEFCAMGSSSQYNIREMQWAWEMAQSAECLSCKPEDLSAIPTPT